MTIEEKADAIRGAWEPGILAKDIAARIPGANKGAVVGYYHRNPGIRADCPLRERMAAVRSENKKRAIVKKAQYVVRSARICSGGVPMSAVTGCRWAVNDAAPGELHLFCNAPGFPYCDEHAAMSRGAGTEGERSATRWLRALTR